MNNKAQNLKQRYTSDKPFGNNTLHTAEQDIEQPLNQI